MIFRTLLFFVVMYFLVKIISRLFLPSKQNNRNKRRGSFFYRTFQQFQQQQQRHQQQGRQRQQSDNSRDRFEEVEEAEYEDITDEEKETSKSPE